MVFVYKTSQDISNVRFSYIAFKAVVCFPIFNKWKCVISRGNVLEFKFDIVEQLTTFKSILCILEDLTSLSVVHDIVVLILILINIH